jgi:hypothetical protein
VDLSLQRRQLDPAGDLLPIAEFKLCRFTFLRIGNVVLKSSLPGQRRHSESLCNLLFGLELNHESAAL